MPLSMKSFLLISFLFKLAHGTTPWCFSPDVFYKHHKLLDHRTVDAEEECYNLCKSNMDCIAVYTSLVKSQLFCGLLGQENGADHETCSKPTEVKVKGPCPTEAPAHNVGWLKPTGKQALYIKTDTDAREAGGIDSTWATLEMDDYMVNQECRLVVLLTNNTQLFLDPTSSVQTIIVKGITNARGTCV